ncbi:MAG: Alpha/beta hydrolase family protein [Lentisphaerae bacterium ADurb.Bin242]|nr:MAG: Alpha/beta hydrolase family protein [Lentisphaerae bacterium ADurb.Bin242]
MGKHFFSPVPVLLFLTTILFCTSCATSDVSIRRRSADSSGNIYEFHKKTDSGLSYHSVNILNGRLALSLFDDNTSELLRILEKEFAEEGNPELLQVMVDVSVTKANQISAPDQAVSYYLSGAIYAYEYMRRFLCDSKESEVCIEPGRIAVILRYNHAVANLFSYLRTHDLLTRDSFQFRNAIGESIRFQKPVCRLPLSLDEFKDLLVCANYEPENMNFFSYRFGVGVPLIALPDFNHYNVKNKQFQPQLTIPATAVMHFRKSANAEVNSIAQMELLWADRTDTVSIHGHPFPLCLDLSTPLAFQMSVNPGVNIIRYMLDPDGMKNVQGLFLAEPYSPDRIPVVFVHGLMSRPRTWAQLFNTLRNDPVIRKKYQFWFFSYSTGMPILYSALQLRLGLDDAYAALVKGNPAAEANFNKMVIVGHSMGGLLTKTIIEDSGDTILRKLFENESAELLKSIPEKECELLKSALIFSPKPYVKRVVFMATPHRGAVMADSWIGRIGSKLISLPGFAIDLGKNVVHALHRLPPEQLLKLHVKTGIENLSPGDPVLCSLASLPFAPGIPYHSVIGNEDKAGVPDGSDGIVPYASAHLDGAKSEIVVKSGHSVQMNPLTALELRRILLLHLKECDEKVPPPVQK